jgi:O-antigen/teichoic acid export membrane protein
MIGLTGLVLMALFRVDALLLAAISGDRAVGEYASAYRLFEAVLFLAYAVDGAVAPVVARRMGDGRELRRLTEIAIAALGAVYVPFAVVALTEAGQVLNFIYGERYTEAAAALRWLAVVPVLYGISAVAGVVLVASDRTRPLLAGAVAALAVNIALNLMLIPSLEGTGAAIATACGYGVEVTIGLAFAATIAPRIRPLTALTEALVAAVPLAAALLLLPLPLVVELPVGLAAYAAAWLLVVRRHRPDLIAVLGPMGRRGGRLHAEA